MHSSRMGVSLLAIFLLLACTSTPKHFYDIPVDRRIPLLIVGETESSRYMAQFDDCFQSDPKTGLETICLDPPPFELRINVLDSVFGPPIPPYLVAETTSHFGSRPYVESNQRLRLYLLVTDGASYIMPRYNTAVLKEDWSGRLAVPIWWTHQLWWLPCGVESLAQEIHFERDAAESADRIGKQPLEENPAWFQVVGSRVIPKRGVYVDEIRNYLKRVSPKGSDMACQSN